MSVRVPNPNPIRIFIRPSCRHTQGVAHRIVLLWLGAGLLLVGSCGESVPSVEPPPAAGRFDYQIGVAYPPADGVAIVARDRSQEPVEGLYNVCYVNAFQSQPEDAEWWEAEHPDLLLRDDAGEPVEDPGWPGEYVLDTSTAAKRTALAEIVGGWLDGCADAGFDGMDADNLDSWTRAGVDGRLDRADNIAFARLLVEHAHDIGLAVAQKNALEIDEPEPAGIDFDFAIAEECEQFGECDRYTAKFGRHVLEIEYSDSGVEAFERACAARAGDISILYSDRLLAAPDDPDYVRRQC